MHSGIMKLPSTTIKGVVIGAPVNFTVETLSTGNGNVEVADFNPQGNAEPVDLKFSILTYLVTYKPRLEGVQKGPDGQPKKVTVTDNNNGAFNATYLADDIAPVRWA